MFDKIKDAVTGGGDLGDLPLGGLEQHLDGVTYPIGVDDLANVLRTAGVPDGIVDKVSGVAESGKTEFSSKEDVVQSVTGGGLGDKLKSFI